MDDRQPIEVMFDPSLPLVLHVEDDDGDARMVARSLSRAQCKARIERVVDGKAALAIVQSIAAGQHEVPDLVLLDLKLPFVSGIDILKKARSFEPLERIPIVVLTSSDVEEDRRLCTEYGCTDYTVKPIDYLVFLETLRGICEKYILPLSACQTATV